MLSTGTEIHHLGLLSDVYLKKYGKGWVMTGVNVRRIDSWTHFDLLTQKIETEGQFEYCSGMFFKCK